MLGTRTKASGIAFFTLALGLSAACSSSVEGTPVQDTSFQDASTANDASSVPTDASTSQDTGAAPFDAGAAPFDAGVPSGSLTFKTAGTLATTMDLGAFTPTTGHAQYRPKPVSGGTLSVSLSDATRTVEITLYDDAGTLASAESFNGDFPNNTQPRKARVTTFRNGSTWQTQGDGTVVVEAFTGTMVQLKFNNLGQFGTVGTDVFVVDGSVAAPVVTLPTTAVGTAALTIANVQNEPITNEPLNMTSSTQPFASASVTLGEATYPYIGDRRAAFFSDMAGATKRTIRVAFPTGHLPRQGETLPLNKFDRVQVTYFEGTTFVGDVAEKVWEADQGSVQVTTRTTTSMTMTFIGARMQSESTAAKGIFELSGTLSFALP